MSLYLPEPPPEGMQLINAALGNLLGQPTSTQLTMADANPDNLVAAAPHHVYFASLESVAGGQMLAQAEMTGWRYIVLDDERPLVAVNLDINADEGNLEFSSVNQGGLIEGTLEAVRIAESLDDVSAENFELRLLEVPSLYVIALWLHGEYKDLLIPLPTSNQKLEAFGVYTEQRLLTAIRGMAVRQLRFSEENV
jgi:hypothetical protein